MTPLASARERVIGASTIRLARLRSPRRMGSKRSGMSLSRCLSGSVDGGFDSIGAQGQVVQPLPDRIANGVGDGGAGRALCGFRDAQEGCAWLIDDVYVDRARHA